MHAAVRRAQRCVPAATALTGWPQPTEVHLAMPNYLHAIASVILLLQKPCSHLPRRDPVSLRCSHMFGRVFL